MTVEDICELPAKTGLLFQRNRSENVRGLSLTEGIDSRLLADAGPRLMERAIKPETGLVLEHHYPATLAGFFLIEGNFSLSHVA